MLVIPRFPPGKDKEIKHFGQQENGKMLCSWIQELYLPQIKYSVFIISVSDPYHFDLDPDPDPR